MTEDEFAASVNWAVTNPCGSGLRDVFGGCEGYMSWKKTLNRAEELRAVPRCPAFM